MSEVPPPLTEDQASVRSEIPTDFSTLHGGERYWRDRQQWLASCGYMLRPRYRPDWVPSWGTDDLRWWLYEDAIATLHSKIMDAIRIVDGEQVVLKKISNSIFPYEVQITKFFSTEPWKSHPHNHCVPLIDILTVPDEPDTSIIVIPLLRDFDNPRVKSVGEAVELFRQLFEGLQFIHQCNVAHRDCMFANIMMDPKPMFPHSHHPVSDRKKPSFKGRAKYYTRTARPTRYYLIDFGLSRKYNPEDLPPLEEQIYGGDPTPPEFEESEEPCDPFPTDIYYLGNMVRTQFLNKTRGVEFMKHLIDDMVQDDPTLRPTIDQVVGRFETMRRRLHWWTLRRRLIENSESLSDTILRTIHHAFRTTAHILLLRSAVPAPG